MAQRKKRRTIIGVSAGIIMLSGFAITVPVILTQKSNIELSKDILDKIQNEINKDSIQDIIDKNEIEKEEDLLPKLEDIISESLGKGIKTTIVKTETPPEESNLKLNTYIKLTLNNPDFNFKFANGINPDDTLYYISKNSKEMYIWLLDDTQPDSQIKYYKTYKISNTKSAYESLVDEIDKSTNRYDVNRFEKAFNASNSTVMDSFYSTILINGSNDIMFNDFISKSIFKKDDGSIIIDLKGKKTENNSIERYKYELEDGANHTNVKLDNKNKTLNIYNLSFYKDIDLKIKSTLLTDIQNFIDADTRQSTFKDFEKIIEENTFKEFLAKSLSDNISVDNIESLSLNERQELVITLKEGRINYNIDKSTLSSNVIVVDDSRIKPKLKISNIWYWTELKVSANEKLFSNIQTYIDGTEKYTVRELKNKLTDQTLFSKLAEGIDDIQVNNIKSLSINDQEEFIINLEKNPGLRKKYVFNQKTPENVKFEIVTENGEQFPRFIISKLNYYKHFNISNVEKAFEILKNEINHKEYTIEEFVQKNEFNNTIKLFTDALVIKNSDTQEAPEYKLFGEPIISSDNSSISIPLDSTFNKYDLENTPEITLDKNKSRIIIKTSTLSFYASVRLTINKGLKNHIQDFISKSNYTAVDMLIEKDKVINKIIENVTNLRKDKVENIELNGNNLIVNLKLNNANGKPEKIYWQNNDSDNTEYTYDEINGQKKYKIIIKNLKIDKFKNIMSDEGLLSLWTNVNNVIISSDIRVSNYSGDDEWNSKKGLIFEIFKQTPVANDKMLSDYIGNMETNVTRSGANIIIKLGNSGSIFDKNICLNQGYIEVNKNNKTIYLNNLSLANPDKYFSWSSNSIKGFSDKGAEQNDVLIPLRATEISGTLSSSNVRNIVISDNVTNVKQNSLRFSSLTSIKYSRKINTIYNQNFSDTSSVRVYMYNNALSALGNRSVCMGNTYNMIYNDQKYFIAPPSVTTIKSDAINLISKHRSQQGYFGSWAYIYEHKVFAGQTYRGGKYSDNKFLFFYDGNSSDMKFHNLSFDFCRWYEDIDAVEFYAAQNSTAWKIKRECIDASPGATANILRINESSRLNYFDKTKYCAVHVIDK